MNAEYYLMCIYLLVKKEANQNASRTIYMDLYLYKLIRIGIP